MTAEDDSSRSPALLLREGDSRVIVHPLVLFHILDHHNRRNEPGSRVIGTLLGRKDDNDRLVEITNAFSVPHAERGEEVAIGKDFNKTMLNLHLRASRKETVVGWYATTTEGWIQDTSSLIHEFYATECDDADPIHLVVDTRLLTDQLEVRAYKSAPVILQGEVLGNLFHELSLTLQSNEPEAIALREMLPLRVNDGSSSSSSDSNAKDKKDPLQVSVTKLYDLLSTACDYVDQVVNGSIPADPALGHEISDALSNVPSIQGPAMDKLFHESLQDLLMVTYLSNITQTQITIAEKLNAALGN